MKTYQSFGALAKEFRRNIAEIEIGMVAAMEISAIAVTGEAKAIIGNYQREDLPPSVKPWEELKDATKADRLRKGYSENDPLMRDGSLWASIGYEASGKQFIVGSTDPIAEYHEYGTEKMAQRAFLAPALYRSVPFMLSTIGASIEKALGGKI